MRNRAAAETTAKLHPAVRWPLWILTRLILPSAILVSIAAGVLWVRLLNGPISLKSIAEPIARAIASDLPGLQVSVEEASVLLAEGRGLEFRLRNVKLADAGGRSVAQAPDAAVTLSASALWDGRIAPSRIVLIEPSLILQYTRERGLSLTFAEAPQLRPGASPGRADEPVPASSAVTQTEVGTALGALLSQDGGPSGTASYIKGIGLRNATLVIDNAGQRAIFRVREADIGMDRRREGRMIGTSLVLDSPRGAWHASVVANREEAGGATTVDLRVNDLVPSAIAAAWPLLGPLAALDLPVNGTASFRVAASGELGSAIADLELGKGSLAPGLRGNGSLPIEGGRIEVKYDTQARRLGVSTNQIRSGESWAMFRGTVALPSEPNGAWQVDIAAVDGQLAAEEFGIGPRPLEALRVRGTLDPQNGAVELTEAVLKAGGGEIVMSGNLPPKGGASRLMLKGRMSPMPVETAKVLWPSVIAPHARLWCGRQIQQGRLVSGTFTVEDTAGTPDMARAGVDTLRISVSIEGSGVRLQPKPGFAPVEAPRVLVRLEGHMLEVVAPDAVVVTAPQRRLQVRGARMISNDVAAANAIGDLTFRAQGQLQPALDLAEQQAVRNGRTFAVPGEGLDGRVDAQVRILVPLGEDLTADDTRLDIKGRVTEGRARNIFGSWDVSSASLNVEISDQQLDTRGDMLVGGVPAKLSLRRIFAAADNEQPPILVSANLDTADRTQLGLDVNEFVVGEMPIEVLISPRTQGDSQVQVRANLTNAELILESLSWKKAQGRPATLQFDIVRPTKQRTELQGFRIVGEDISLSGALVLDGRNKLREFALNELALHVVSRLQVSGTLKGENVWDVTVRGQTLDGRDFFKSLFSFNQLRAKPLPARKDQAGLDIKIDIDNVLGHHDVSLKGLKMQMSNRAGRTVSMQARGTVDSGGRQTGSPLEVSISQAGRDTRRLVARSDDAGQVFRLIGFFPNMLGGTMSLDANLDASGAADKSGRLNVWNFAILGDAAGDVIDIGEPQRGQRRTQQRSRLDFISMNAPFELGHGQLVIRDADLRGQVLGVVVRGKVDFRQQTVDLGGTYVPLQGLNSAVGQFPLLGIILAGPRGEGVIGMTFAVQGSMARPQVVVNPASIIPGILREMMQMTNPDPRITPRDGPAQPQAAPAKAAEPAQKAAPKRTPPARPAGKPSPSGSASPQIDAEGGWSSSTVKSPSQ